MILGSEIPASVTPAIRLREYYDLVRDLSIQSHPEDLLAAYRRRSQLVVPYDQFMSLSRRRMEPPHIRITRSTRWVEPIDPFREPERLPVVDTGILPELVYTGRPIKIDNLDLEPDDPAAPYFEGMHSLIAVPLFDHGDPLNMTILMREEPAAFTLDELSTFLLTANLIGRTTSHMVLTEDLRRTHDALRRAHDALDREFKAVGEIQRDLLPQETPEIADVRIATFYETSTRAGGDYYDFFDLGEGNWGFLIADVSGHGTPAAVVMARMHALLHSPLQDCPCNTSTPARVLQALNSRISQAMRPGNFVTAFFGVLDAKTRRMRYALAGHNPPRVLRRGAARPEPLEPTEGLPLGVVEPMLVTDNDVSFETGDRLVLYTDGITETFSTSGEMFDVPRLDAAIVAGRASADSLVCSVIEAVADHRGSTGKPADDRTLVAIAFD
ncbi:Phosphoserine phosphatase RsbU [Phycisphaerae bacterium RAS1]|nr:Phosphoserine phosphatase RsbU [Phycisphaerae bacterium RAS1]